MKPILVLLTLFCIESLAHACPNCGKAERVMPDKNGDPVIEAPAGNFNSSTYLLLSGVLGGGAMMFWVIRQGVGAASRRDDQLPK